MPGATADQAVGHPMPPRILDSRGGIVGLGGSGGPPRRAPQRRLGPEPTWVHALSPQDQTSCRWIYRLSCPVSCIPLNRSGISATVCCAAAHFHCSEAVYRLGSDRGSPNQGSTLLSKRV